MTTNIIEIEHLIKEYETGAGVTRILRDASLNVRPVNSLPS
jgi:hypothetical protein